MKQFTHHAWLHIIIAAITIIYVLFGPQVFTRFFVRQGKPIAYNALLPSVTTPVQYMLDSVDATSTQGYFILTGWAFQTRKADVPVSDYERQVVFHTESDNYIFHTNVVPRPFVQDFYDDYGLDVTMSGFSTLIYRDTIKPGTYGIGLIFTDVKDRSTFYVSLDHCITRTPNNLRLEDLRAAACRAITHNEGRPVGINSPIPHATITTRLQIETLSTLEESEMFQLSGWAFPIDNQGTPSSSFERKIVLSNEHDDYFFSARTIPRYDVQAAFTDLEMDLIESGFMSIISASVLEKGSYRLGLIFTRIADGKEFFIDFLRCVTRAEDGLVLEVFGDIRCRNASP
jgi:hypothetical protein